MYGLIHRAARQLAISRFGAEAWHGIAANADIHDDDMVSAQVYSDDTTIRMLDAVRAAYGVEMEDFLEAFGVYWVEFAAESAYGAMLDMTGTSLHDCLRNLDRLHSGIKLTLPSAVLPSFTVLESGKNFVNVRYSSARVGLEPFVKGLLMGLLKRFDLEGRVVAVGPSDLGVIFHVSYEV
jgi:Haem-NO-binding